MWSSSGTTPPQEFGNQPEEDCATAEVEVPEEAEAAGAAAAKREGNPDPAKPLPKRRRKTNNKVGPDKIVDNKSLPGNPLQDVPMQMKSQVGLSLQVFVGN